VANRAPQAQGHLVAADALEGSPFPVGSLADKRADIAVVAEFTDRAVLHVRRDDVGPLLRKIRDFGNPEKRTKTGRPKNEPLVASLEGFRAPTLVDLSEGWLRDAEVEDGRLYWVELWARGGVLADESTRERVRAEVEWLANEAHEADRVRRFRATERDVYLVRLPGEILRRVAQLVPEVYRIAEASRPLREFHLIERGAEALEAAEIVAPSEDASTVVVLDTGVAPEHPLLRPALRSDGVSVVVGDPSPIDTDGHGTEIAGVAAYGDLSSAIRDANEFRARVWLFNARLLAANEESDDDREFWPDRTEAAVLAAEDEEARRRIFNLCISAEHPDPGDRTSWSVGLDLLAFNDGAGRVFCVAGGNADVGTNPDDYPVQNLSSFIDDPAQALNVITVGATTELVALPDDDLHRDLAPVAPFGGLSPYSRVGITGSPIKPDVLFEGGNCAPDGTLPNVGIETLSRLTTSKDHGAGRLFTYSWATSAACSALSGFAGEVWAANPWASPETVRGLIVHSARWTEALRHQFPDQRDLLRAAGYGVPSVDAAAYSWRGRPTIVVQDGLRPATPRADGGTERPVHFIRLPLPDEELLALGEQEVELAITLSFFAEPNEANRRNYAGASLRWDIQRSTETTEDFRQRVNRLERNPDFTGTAAPYAWEIGTDVRARGTVQSDRCRLTAASLAGERSIAVFPVLGWWEGRSERVDSAMSYGLIATVDVGDADVDLYTMVQAAIEVSAEVALDVEI
jgi:hypothetical protein